MSTFLIAIVGALICASSFIPSGTARAADQQNNAEVRQELKALQEQVQALQKRLDAQVAAEQQAKAEAEAAGARAAAASAALGAVPDEIKTAVEAAAPPKSDKLQYKGVAITLGGFVEGATVYRQHDTNNDIGTTYSTIPFGSSATANTSQLLFTARASRFSALVQGDANPSTHLSMYSELDLQGAAQTANSKESNSYNPRLRQLYGLVDRDDLGLHFLAGQAWSLITLNSSGISPFTELNPPTVDSQYLPGYTWARQPQLRLTKDFDQHLWFAVSVENPQTTFYTGANALPSDVHLTYEAAGTGLGFNSANELSLNHIPDAIAKFAFELPLPGRRLHVEASALYSEFSERLDYANRNTSGGGFGGGLIAPIVPSYVDFQLSGLAGKGIGRYGSGQLTEVTFDPAGHLVPIHEVIALAGLTLHATPRFDWYVFAGEDKESAAAYTLVSPSGERIPYGYGNALYSNTGCFSETAPGTCVGNEARVEQATTGFWWRPYEGPSGTIRTGIQYSHTEFQSFTGKGGAPGAIQNMVFFSVRYYPYTQL